MNEKDTFDKILDTLIDEAIPIVESMPDEDLPDEIPVEYSEDFEKRMKKIFATERKKIRRKQILKNVRRIAACFAIFIVVSGITVMSVSALRVKILNLIFNSQETNTEVQFEDSDQSNDYDNVGLELMYVPDGFEIVRKDIQDKTVYLRFENDDLYFSVTLTESTGTISLDTEDANVEEININGNKALYAEKSTLKTLTGMIEDYSYT
ncbi:MAG TPA: DUF4367 domain-containing protein, partial [Candidatus Ornithomonoglobus merdipullorum]|nr:DUF4367 domain-containing protein [Candidatus Ornithomonoglobus merdipullorum]